MKRLMMFVLALLVVVMAVPAAANDMPEPEVSWTKIVEEANILADSFYLEIKDVAVNPLDESQIYLATASDFGRGGAVPPGLLRSTDGGRTWSEVKGLTREVNRVWRVEKAPLHVPQVVLNPKDPKQIYVSVYGHGICRSRDGGETWESILYNVNEKSYNTPEGFPYSLEFAVDPQDFNRIFAWTQGYTLTGWRLFFESRDGGNSWVKLDGIGSKDEDSGTNGYPGAVRIRMYNYWAKQPSDLVLEWSADGGNTWHKTMAGELNPAIGQPGEPEHNVPRDFYFDPHQPRVYGFSGRIPPGLASYWIGTIEDERMKWEKLDMPDGLGMWGLSFDPQHPNVVYLEVSLWNGQFGPADARTGLYISADAGRMLVKVPKQPANAYAEVTEVLRKSESTVLYVKLFPVRAFAWTKNYPGAGHSTLWRVEIPDSFIRQPIPLRIRTTLTLQIGSKEMVVKKTGEKQTIILDAAPEIPTGTERTFLPIRPVVEALGGKILWFGDEQRVEIQQGDRKVVLWINRATALVDGIEVPIDAANPAVRPYIAPPGRTMLPLRFIVEALGAKVEWIGETRTIIITYPKPAAGQ